MSFRVGTIKHTIRRKTRLFFSFLFFPQVFATKASECLARRLFPDQFTSTRPALHTSVSITVLCEIAHAGSHEPYDNIDYFSPN